MKTKTITLFILLILIISVVNAQKKNLNKMYLAVGNGICKTDGALGPCWMTEFGYGITKDLYISSRLTITTNNTINNNIEYKHPGEPKNYNTFFDFSLCFKYHLPAIERLKLGGGISSEINRKIVLKRYSYSEDKFENILLSSGIIYGMEVVTSAEYVFFQKNDINIGINGDIHLGALNSYMAGFYVEFGS